MRARWAALPPGAGAAVMATGVLSVGLHLIGQEPLSRVALGLAAALWLLLAAGFAARLAGDRARWRAEADTPPALTAVAATTVLGTRLCLLGWRVPAAALLVVAVALWPGLLLSVVRHWRWRMPGSVFLVCVATQGLAVLTAALSLAGAGDWLGAAGWVPFWLGLLLYVPALARFDLRQVGTGAGDQWVAGGALAISALAAAMLAAAPPWTGAAHHVLRTAALVLLALSLAWYVVLTAAELIRPRLRYDVRRWSTVFPLGMTAVAALATATVIAAPALHTLGRVLLWIGVGAWLLTAAGLLAGHGRGRGD
ncbi:hypothetical protein ACIQU6_09405 [Streptomyces sp. NPDC090442]|uniref:SLAC1 family transporter n=1 Tax=Streptomyces sp. NPDC090442 TaxID=3365962 RepID=UPI00382A1CF1